MNRRGAQLSRFRTTVLDYWKEHGRHDLPWRKTVDPYKILVSEIMLQQTQVPRVIEKYKEFLKAFPTVHTLARAPLSDVLNVWSGLGYNRRGKYLHDAAKVIALEFRGDLKEALAHPLPGVGPYTRAAVRVFAFNEPHTMIETNIRTVFLHHFGRDRTSVADKALLPFIEQAAKRQDPRTWHWALMDYGSYLKRTGVRNNSQSRHYTKQSNFEGSLRQVRGAILRELHKAKFSPENPGGQTSGKNWGKLPFPKERVEKALAGLVRDGLIVKEKGKWRIA